MKLPTSTLGQSAVFAAGVLVLGLLNSLLNPNALSLSTDYFPVLKSDAAKDHATKSGALKERDYQVKELAEVHSYLDLLFEEPPYVMFLDARSAEHYENGHIAGAFLLDQYHQDRYIEDLLPNLKETAMIVVYCTGGDCEDSIFLRHNLIYNYQIEEEKIFIFEGGVELWENAGYPLKQGAQR